MTKSPAASVIFSIKFCLYFLGGNFLVSKTAFIRPWLYIKHNVENRPVGSALVKIAHNDLETMRISFNSAYYLAKNERLFSDYANIIQLQQKGDVQKFTFHLTDRSATNFIIVGKMLKNDLTDKVRKCKYISLLSNSSTDTAINQEELVYLLFMTEQGNPEVKFLSIESPECATTEG